MSPYTYTSLSLSLSHTYISYAASLTLSLSLTGHEGRILTCGQTLAILAKANEQYFDACSLGRMHHGRTDSDPTPDPAEGKMLLELRYKRDAIKRLNREHGEILIWQHERLREVNEQLAEDREMRIRNAVLTRQRFNRIYYLHRAQQDEMARQVPTLSHTYTHTRSLFLSLVTLIILVTL